MSAAVVVTGFGPFGHHTTNASWETAKLLKTMDFTSHDIDLTIEEIPVIYDTVVSMVPALWEKYKPQLMVHIGVSSLASEITLETVAFKDGYSKADVQGNCPGVCCHGNDECLMPVLDVEKVCIEINTAKEEPASVCISQNAGRYLCEFTFYTSLTIDKSRVVFIHVPDIDKPYSVDQLAKTVKKIILLLMEQINALLPQEN